MGNIRAAKKEEIADVIGLFLEYMVVEYEITY